MNLYGVKFRELGEKKYNSAIIQANDEKEAVEKFNKMVEKYDIDKRTMSWAGDGIPLGGLNGDIVVLFDTNLDNIT